MRTCLPLLLACCLGALPGWGAEEARTEALGLLAEAEPDADREEVSWLRVDVDWDGHAEPFDYDPAELLDELPRRSESCSGLRPGAGECDAFHFYWDHDADDLAWWRL